MSDENVLIVQADTAETSLGWATLGERALALHGGCRRYPRGQGRGRCRHAGRRISRCAASISATTGWSCPRSACRPGRSASTTAGATTRARRPTTGWSTSPTSGATRRCGARTGSTISWSWSATTTIRPKANGAAPSSSTSRARIIAGTQGCVAFSRDDLLELVPLLDPRDAAARPVRCRRRGAAALGRRRALKQFEDFDEKDW